MQNNISKLDDIHSLDELRAIREAHRQEEAKVAEAIKQAEARIRHEEWSKRRQQEQEFRSNLAANICGTHDLSYGSCVMIVNRVWMDYQSYGTQEVANAAEELADFVEQVVKHEYPHQ